VVAERFAPALALQDDPANWRRGWWQRRPACAATSSRSRHCHTHHFTVAIEEEVEASTYCPRRQRRCSVAAHDLDLICRRLVGHQGRLLTLTGAPGVGKTRLALETAHRLAPLYTHGACFIDLSAVATGDVPYGAGAGFRPGTGAQRPAAAGDRPSAAQADCCSCWITWSSSKMPAALVGDLLAASPRVCIIATSRQRLHLRSEQRFVVAPLALDAAVELFAACVAASDPEKCICRRHSRRPWPRFAANWIACPWRLSCVHHT
jgi:hypothetical protein